jgi:hypothetical protein
VKRKWKPTTVFSAVTRNEPIAPPVSLIPPVLVFSAAITFQVPTFGCASARLARAVPVPAPEDR